MKLKIKKLHPDAVVPQYQTAGAACFDLYAIEADKFKPHPKDAQAAIFRTGLAVEIPAGWVMEIHSRSSQGFLHAVRLSNCTGQIDADYRGEIMVALRLDGDVGPFGPFTPRVRSGDRIAQAKLVPAPRVEFEVVEELTTTERGTGGFGSTGA